MALRDVWVKVDYFDAAERTATKEYLLRTQLDTADTTTIDAVLSDAADLVTALNVASWDSTPDYRVELAIPGGGSPAVTANNQVTAFTRIYDVDGVKGSIEVPAWDDLVFDEDNQNILDPTYDVAIAVAALLLRDPVTKANFALVPQYTQSRTRRSRNVIHD